MSRSRIIISADEVVLSAGIGNSTTVNNARAVRVYNNSGADAVVYQTDADFTGIGSVTVKSGDIETFEKRPNDYLYYTGRATMRVARVGIAN